MTTIKSIDGRDLYVAEAETVRGAVEEAVAAGANLSGAYLNGANLTGANLSGAYLTGANLTWANLSGANLTWANLTGANLTGANLTGANLTWANLTGAYLTGAYLTGANLTWANLTGANLTGAYGINFHRVEPLLMLLDQPGPIRAYKLVTAAGKSPIQSTGKLTYKVGKTLTVKDADTDPAVQCGPGINVATLPWVMREWRPGYRILVVEFTAADIAAIPVGDGKFRLHRCTVVGEKDLAELGLTEAAA